MGGLGSRLRISREKKRLTQIEVAKILGISNGTLSGYERDYRDPDTETLSKLAQLYDVSLDWLLTGRNEGSFKATKKESKDEIANVFFREWDKASSEKKKRTLEFLQFLNQTADKENDKG